MELTERLDKDNIQDIQILTPMQEGILFHYLKNPESKEYFVQMRFHLSGNIDIVNIKRAFLALQRENEVLRSVFRWQKIDRPVQIILKECPVDFRFHDLARQSGNNIEEVLSVILEADQNERIDIQKHPFRISICSLAHGIADLIISYNHILYDGWSNGILIKEFVDYYNDLQNGIEILVKPKMAFREYKKEIDRLNNTKGEEFWKKYLNGFIEKTQLPYSKPKLQELISIRNLTAWLSEEMTHTIRKTAKDMEITLAEFLYGVWGALLCRYNNTNDVVYGTTVAGRPPDIAGIENAVGLFINTVPLRVAYNVEETVASYLISLKRNVRCRKEFETTPLISVKKFSPIDSKETLFDSILIIENYPIDKNINKNDSNLTITFKSIWEMTNYDLVLQIQLLTNGIELSFSYNSDVFHESVISQMAEHFKNLAVEFCEFPAAKLINIKMLGEKEEKQILYTFNDTFVKYPHRDKTVHELFEEQVEKLPNQIAVIDRDRTLTYQELNERANKVAHVLINNGVKNNRIVALIAERSFEMVIGIIGILKAGGAYLPIDPYYPEKRIEYLLTNSNADIILIQNKWPELNFKNRTVINFDSECVALAAGLNPIKTSFSDSLAYVIYTSGSTGDPKGVMIEHHALVNRLNWMQEKYPIDNADTILQKTPYTFDVSVWELLWWAVQGASVCMLEPDGEKNPQLIIAAIKRHKITTIHFVPPMLHAFLDFMERNYDWESVKSLKRVFASGQELKMEHVSRFYRLLNDKTTLHNLYGPTEAAIDVTYFDCKRDQVYTTIPIGKPIANIKLYIVDKHNQLMPIGVPGELCIAGAGLARGYINQPELTEAQFVKSPYDHLAIEEGYQKYYKTGDLARWCSDGNIEYLGRMDNQIKIRGLRIELGEIESKLAEHPSVQEVIVLILGDSEENMYLQAYIVKRNKVESSDLKRFLRQFLPEYMIPVNFIFLDQMPKLIHGKINRKALAIIKPAVQSGSNVWQPANEYEMIVLEIWQQILNRSDIDFNENFFDIGGNSIMLIRMHSLVNKRFPGQVTVADLFSYSTITQLALFISDKYQQKSEKLTFGGIMLPENYFHLSGFRQEREILKYEIEKEIFLKLKKVSEDVQIGLKSILISLFISLVQQITQQRIVPVQSLVHEDKKIYLLEIDFYKVPNLSVLFHLVNKKLQVTDCGKKVKVEEVNDQLVQKDKNLVLLFLCDRTLIKNSSGLLNLFDIVLEMENLEETMNLYFHYDNGRLKMDKMESMFEYLIKLIKAVVSNDL